jgi:hypothetical protein
MRKTSAVPYGQSNVGTERGPAGTGNGLLPFFFVSPAIITAGSTVLVDYIVLLVANI